MSQTIDTFFFPSLVSCVQRKHREKTNWSRQARCSFSMTFTWWNYSKDKTAQFTERRLSFFLGWPTCWDPQCKVLNTRTSHVPGQGWSQHRLLGSPPGAPVCAARLFFILVWFTSISPQSGRSRPSKGGKKTGKVSFVNKGLMIVTLL